ncbi:hypothetical protein [Chryseobacterium polytrichastri]|uniref:Uncharacterized protein n=1 Tax=Chryseobacterium polytrichastri TaxID=1302687 RepID=A0A1M7JPQ8_9FLAO|nr:hypothetical protein [Chryseobacterium polytrichastri]SHM54988.1 hypothetical protein SAMN05444267_10549 [Chryseobacterium polytrichastri]
MNIQLYLKWIYILLFLFILSCNGQNEKNKSSLKTFDKNQRRIAEINFLDKKYFHGYQLSPSSDYPIYNHIDNKFGDLVVNFIDKDFQKQKDWEQFDFNNGLDSGDDPDERYFNALNEIIKNKLEPNLNNYAIIAEYIPAKYLEKKTLNYIYPYTKTYYLYNEKQKTWNFLKEKTISDGADEKNITKLTELNAMIGIKESNTSNNTSIPLNKLDGLWADDCNSDKTISISSTIKNAQFGIPNRFSMNAQLKKIDNNKYELYFTDFPPIIPLPDEMQNWENMDNEKPVGYFEIINDSKINLTWFGFYYKKTKKYIQTENPFNKNNTVASIIRCSDN